MNDYWDYLEHGQEGQERKGHKYYARVPVGKNKLGFTKYRYFYDAREYGAYMTRQRQGIPENNRAKLKGRTTFTTGTGEVHGSMKAPSDMKGLMTVEERDLIRSTGEPTGNTEYRDGKQVSNVGVYNAKTEKDYGKSLRNGKEKVKKLLRKASKAHNENRYTDTVAIGVGTDYLYREQKNRINGKTKATVYTTKGAANNYERTIRDRKKAEKERQKYEPIYQAHKAYHKASVAAKKGALTVKRLLTTKPLLTSSTKITFLEDMSEKDKKKVARNWK